MLPTERFVELDRMSNDVLVALREDLGLRAHYHGQQVRRMDSDMAAITQILRRRGKAGVEITDHALVRYMERFEGFDAHATRDRIRERVERAMAATPGVAVRAKGDAVSYSDGGAAFIVARGNAVVTCHDGEKP